MISATDRSASSVQAEFNRPPRIIDQLPRDEIELPAPPSLPQPPVGQQLGMILIPALTGVFYLIAFLARGNQGGNIWFSLPIIVMSLLSAGVAFWNYYQQREQYRQAKAEYDRKYTEALERARKKLTDLTERQATIYQHTHPDPQKLSAIVSLETNNTLPQPRLWERRIQDTDFLHLRIGLGDRPTTLNIKTPSANEFQFSPELESVLQLAREFSVVRNVPLVVPLPQTGALGIAGSDQCRMEFAHWLIWQIVVHHAPYEARLAAFWPRRHDRFWSWLHWLPHTRSFDDDSYRLLARYDDPADPGNVYLSQVLNALLREAQQRREYGLEQRARIVILLDNYHEVMTRKDIQNVFASIIDHSRTLGMYVLCLVPETRLTPGGAGGYIDLSDNAKKLLALAGSEGGRIRFKPDYARLAQSDAIAKKLASLDRQQLSASRELPRSVRFSTLLELGELRQYDPQWTDPDDPGQSWHAVPVGVSGPDERLEINLNEGIHGVHGIIAGTTGSGKSEFLLTFIMALAVKHSPDRLNLLLIDFKGGATFKDVAGLPHTVGMVTDLSANEAERALIAINSALDKRKRELQRVGATNIREYRKLRLSQPSLEPMPNLMIVIDEFDEMVRDYPEFVDELIRVAKQGRSLGVHLLFATQQPSQVKEGLTRNLTYRVALRVTSADDSKTLVGIPDASYLTTETPGRGYFGVNRQVQAFQSARITLPYQPFDNEGDIADIDITGRRHARNPDAFQIGGETELSLLIAKMQAARPASYAAQRYPVWREPLPSLLPFVDLRDAAGPESAWMRVPLGLLDYPAQADQRPFLYDPLRAHGNLLVVGAARSGKTTLLRTLLIAIASAHSPDQVWMYTIDADGRGCGLAPRGEAGAVGLPHLAHALNPRDRLLIERLQFTLGEMIEERRQFLQQSGTETIAECWQRWFADQSLPKPPPIILVAIDGVGELAEDLQTTILSSIGSTRPYGIIFIATGGSEKEVRLWKNQFETRIVLRVNDDNDSEALLNKRVAAKIRADQPGRAFLRETEGPVELQIAAPLLRPLLATASKETGAMAVDLSAELQWALERIHQRYAADSKPEPLRLPEDHIDLSRLWQQCPGRYPFALDAFRLQPVELDDFSHILIAGAAGSGKDVALRAVLATLAVKASPADLQFVLIDPRRTALDYFEESAFTYRIQAIVPDSTPNVPYGNPDGFVKNWTGREEIITIASTEAEVAAVCVALYRQLQARVNERKALGRKYRPQPRLVLVVNEMELFVGQEPNYLALLAQYALRGRDIGFQAILVAADFGTNPWSGNNLVRAIKAERCGLYLGRPADVSSEVELAGTGVKWQKKLVSMPFPPARGLLRRGDQQFVVQVAVPDDQLIRSFQQRLSQDGNGSMVDSATELSDTMN